MNGTIWGELDLAPTRDLRAIRKAYAARLKTIDAEADPQAFIALREAYERATLIASQPESGWADEDEDRADGETESAAEDDGRGRDPADPEERGWRIFSEMADILRDPERQDADLDADEQERLNALLADWLGWLQQVPIDLSRPYEWQLAHLVAGTIPRSDPLVEPACAWFGWDTLRDQWDTPPAIQFILDRRQGNRAYAALLDPSHRWHKAFLSLTADQPEPSWKRPKRDDVFALLHVAQTKYPSVYAAFNLERVGEWERRLDDGANNWTTRALVVAGIVIWFFGSVVTGLVSNSFRSPSPIPTPTAMSAPSTPLNDPVPPLDLQDAVGADLPLDKLRAINPVLVGKLEEELRIARRDRETQDALRFQAQEWLNDAYNEERSAAHPDLLRDYWRLWIERAEYYRAQRPSICVDFLRGRRLGSDGGAPVAPLPGSLLERQRQMRARFLLTVKPASRPVSSRQTTIPGAVVQQLLQRTGLSEVRLSGALRGEGLDSDICLTNLTLARIVIDDPSADAVRIMREM